MNIKGNQHWLNSYDCRFLVFIKERKPVPIQEIKNLARMYRETSTGKIFRLSLHGFGDRKCSHMQEFAKKVSRNSIK